MGQSSVLQNGSWYKVAVSTRGVYRISYDQFKKMGFDPGSTDPRKIRIYGNDGGMIPQANAATRPIDLQETSIFVSGESDGVFDKGDYIVFYGDGPDKVNYDQQRQIFSYEHNLYATRNFYFVTVSDQNGKRVATADNLAGSFGQVSTFDDFVYHEVDDYNDLSSGREWFGERYDLTTTYAYRYDIPGIVDNSKIRIVSDVMAQSFGGSSFKLSFNKNAIAEQIVEPIVNSQYSVKGIHQRDTLTIDASAVKAPGNTQQELRYDYVKSSTGKNIGFLDFQLIQYTRRLALYGNQTIFTASASLAQSTSTFVIQGADNNTMIWDVTSKDDIKFHTYELNGAVATFSAPSIVLRNYIAFNAGVMSPEFVGSVANQNLRGLPAANFIIVSHPNFKSEAERLAAHRRVNNNLSVVVVTPEEIYNEFSSGRQDVSAIRDFVRSMYAKTPGTLRALLIVGKGSFDYKDRLPNNTNFVPAYESRNSLYPLQTYSSDDFYAFMEDNEGEWREEPVQNHTLDIGVGRLPVKTLADAKNVVDKIIGYDTNKKNYGYWRKDIVFLADDGSNLDGFSTSHQSQANSIADNLEAIYSSFDTKKIFLGTFNKTVMPNGEVIPEVNKEIDQWFNRGAVVINYTGHGSEKLLADEKVFTEVDIDGLKNKLYPFLVTATCEFGRQDHPSITSSAELSLIHPSGGAIGLVTTARPVNSPTNFILNQQFYTSLMQKENGMYKTIGQVFRETKNNSISGVANRNFSLIGDPSLTLSLPTNNIVINNLQTQAGTDTLKALSTVIVSGEVQDQNGVRMDDFNGTIESTLYDKLTDRVTIGKNNPAFKFKERSNALYRGKASVKNGAFEFQFIVSKNIAYEFGKGKLSMYASDPIKNSDAAGAISSVIVGGSEHEPGTDTTPPAVAAFMGDTTFVNGGVITPNTTLVVKLSDASGINISTYGVGNTLIGKLDDGTVTYNLSDYYQSQTDDFTKGWVYFPITGLETGKHTITINVWDTFNNPAQAFVDFIVTDGEDLIIETMGNTPNPFQNETTIFFTHNRSGDDLEAMLSIYTSTGQVIKSYNFDIPASPYHVNLLEINGLTDFGKYLPGGVYLARLAVRSLANGSKSERVAKLIVLN
ncbi:MAG: type IX secretion system sortase PorU [Chryseolinea sp.]